MNIFKEKPAKFYPRRLERGYEKQKQLMIGLILSTIVGNLIPNPIYTYVLTHR